MSDRYLLISADDHAGPPLPAFSPYFDREHREEFDRYWRARPYADAAEAAADFAMFLYTDAPPNGEAETVAAMDVLEVERGMLTTLPHGWKTEQTKPEQHQARTLPLEAGPALPSPDLSYRSGPGGRMRDMVTFPQIAERVTIFGRCSPKK